MKITAAISIIVLITTQKRSQYGEQFIVYRIPLSCCVKLLSKSSRCSCFASFAD